MNTCSINFLNSFNYHQIYAMIYIYIYKRTHTTKQNKSNFPITQNTQLQKKKETKGEKYQPLQNYNPRFRTHKSNKKIKIKTTNLIIIHTTKSTNLIKEQKGKKIVSFIHKTPQKHREQKKIPSTALPIVGAVGSREFK